ncbi:S8 family serine peptidase [Nakamurella sp. YIM 132087]|uniref:S8 family serine peptidase n=1 Tax=Nakamurella alba TaxID=2665158 RepID=A0A7K1FP56_9ACTN|nr:S8 family serine peptidase [Nakamurella alba]MTD14594.1 S8 family serine peptidase [Nakamurella alba]
MPTTTTLTVHVTSTDGTPVVGARVTRIDPDRSRITAETDRRGRTSFDLPASLPARVSVIADGWATDERDTGGEYPQRDDGVEQFVLGPVGWPTYFRGRVRVPFRPVHDAVGVRSTPGRAGADVADGEVIRFADPGVTVVRLPELQGQQPADAPAVFAQRAVLVDDAVRGLRGRSGDDVEEVGALVQLGEDSAAFLTGTVHVSLMDDVDPVDLAARNGFEVVKRFSALRNTYVFRSPEGGGYDLLGKIDRLAAEPGIRYAEPDLAATVVPDAVTPNDFLFPQQWDFLLEGIPDAWQVLRDLDATHTFGDPDLIVAVVDNGVDPGHPAIGGTVSDGRDKVVQLFDFGSMVNNHNATNSGDNPDHGMCCASAITGRSDDGIGICGVAGNTRLLATRHPGTETRFAELYLWLAGLDADSSAAGFPAQLAQGAGVITNSFGSSVNAPISALMQDTFDAVTDDGRSGLGTVLMFSAGNDTVDLDDTNRRPWSMYNRCYGVSAVSLDPDGTTERQTWYSNWGSTVDFCALTNDAEAPGHNPPGSWGAFTATHRSTPTGTAVPGSAVTSTTLRAASGAAASTIDVDSVAGAAVGGSVLVGPTSATTSRGRTITSVDAANRRIGLDMALPAAFANGTAVVFADRAWRSDFGGTSYATPVTAGVAALMLSANPQLSWQQVGDILRRTAIKVDTGNTDPVGRWRDVDGRISSDPGYLGPATSEWYGAGRIDARAAVRRAAWTVDLVTQTVEFNDIPEGETTFRAVRVDVHSLHPSTVSVVTAPTAPFSLPLGATDSLAGTAQYSSLEEALIWVAFTGTTAGATASGSITVRHDQTDQVWTVPIVANTVAPVTAAVMLVLDSSGSMDSPSGVASNTRMEVLHYSANILVDYVQEGDAVGIVGFDTDAGPVLVPPAGPLAAPAAGIDIARDALRDKIDTFATNPAGMTSIGDGLALGQGELAPVNGYDTKSAIVFTDGFENQGKFLRDVSSSITDRTFAVALGRAENIQPVGLTAVTAGTGGYCVLTGDLGPDSRYRLAKYFLQVLAGVKNQEVVVDPPVQVAVGQTVDVPFLVAETDFTLDVVLLTRYPWLVSLTLVTPDGDVVDPAFVNGLSGRNYTRLGDEVVYYRLTLPAPIGAGAHTGTWLARVELPKNAVKVASQHEGLTRDELVQIRRGGVGGVLLVHASSSLRMDVGIKQDSNEPGATLYLSAALTEYGIPVAGRAKVTATITDPVGSSWQQGLTEVASGVFEAAISAPLQGVWTVLFHAEGETFRSTPFTREAVRTAAVWRGGDSYEPTEGEEPTPKKHREREALRALLLDAELESAVRSRLTAVGLSADEIIGG